MALATTHMSDKPENRRCLAFRRADGTVVPVTEVPDDPGLLMAIMRGDDIRTKGDLRDWTGSPTFHLDQSSPSKQGTKP